MSRPATHLRPTEAIILDRLRCRDTGAGCDVSLEQLGQPHGGDERAYGVRAVARSVDRLIELGRVIRVRLHVRARSGSSSWRYLLADRKYPAEVWQGQVPRVD